MIIIVYDANIYNLDVVVKVQLSKIKFLQHSWKLNKRVDTHFGKNN